MVDNQCAHVLQWKAIWRLRTLVDFNPFLWSGHDTIADQAVNLILRLDLAGRRGAWLFLEMWGLSEIV